jgi:hypothetical protein
MVWRPFVEPAAPETGFLEPFERARKIDRRDQRHQLQRTRRRLGECATCRRRAMRGDDHGQRAECRRGAQDRADIMRIAHLVEHHQHRALGD